MASKLITLVRNLQQRKGRKRANLAVAEGVRLVEEALEAGLAYEGAVVSPALTGTPRGKELFAQVASRAIHIEEVPDHDFESLACTDTPQGVLLVLELPEFQLDDIEPGIGSPVLVVDGVQDPGNLGALLRSAFGLGAAGALLLAGTADLRNAKSIRASMGAGFRLPVTRVSDDELRSWVSRNQVTLWAAVSEGVPVDRARSSEKIAIVLGNEGAGVRPEIEEMAHQRVTIPLSRGAESLNVAVAAGILLYEVQRAG